MLASGFRAAGCHLRKNPRKLLIGFKPLSLTPLAVSFWGERSKMLCVRKEDLRLGMFIQSLEGSWFDHPFWKSKFLLAEADDLRALQSSDVDCVWVDQDKSLAPALAHLNAPAPAPAPAAVERPTPEPLVAPAPQARPRRAPRPNE